MAAKLIPAPLINTIRRSPPPPRRVRNRRGSQQARDKLGASSISKRRFVELGLVALRAVAIGCETGPNRRPHGGRPDETSTRPSRDDLPSHGRPARHNCLVELTQARRSRCTKAAFPTRCDKAGHPPRRQCRRRATVRRRPGHRVHTLHSVRQS